MQLASEIASFREQIYRGQNLNDKQMNNILQGIGIISTQNVLDHEKRIILNQYIKLCIEALQNKDYVYLADILYFEIRPLTKDC